MNGLSSMILQRKAIIVACIGSFYNIIQDCFCGQSDTIVKLKQLDLVKPIKCIIIENCSNQNENLLERFDIDIDLRLSLLLNLTHHTGITNVLNYENRIDSYTRVLYYSWTQREETIDENHDFNLDPSVKIPTATTHIVTGIQYGIEIVIVFHMKRKTVGINNIDDVLQKLKSLLLQRENESLLTEDENDLLKSETGMVIYSNTTVFTGLLDINDILLNIYQIKNNPTGAQPIKYFLKLFPNFQYNECGAFIEYNILPSELSNELEDNIRKCRLLQRNNKLLIESYDINRSFKYLIGKHYQLCNRYELMKAKYEKHIERLSQLLICFRIGNLTASTVESVLHDEKKGQLINELSELHLDLTNLVEKSHFIDMLHSQKFYYFDVSEFNIGQNDNEVTIHEKLNFNHDAVRILCSNDTLNNEDREKFEKLKTLLLEQREGNSAIRLIYADFSYSSYKLSEISVILSDCMQQKDANVSHPQLSIILKPTKELLFSGPKMLNVLLLGETGVGKSTFINALANYLQFESFTEAKVNEPIVAVPVSFMLSVGSNSEERHIEFGNNNQPSNEHFNAIGQSVTQNCSSYLFNLKETSTKLCIIDTPGFNDTRGIAQDEQNIEGILKYISNLTHLNAICFLLKSNSTRSNERLRSCFTQLLSQFTPAAHRNLMFFCTNSRSTFHTPGNTMSSLKSVLESLSVDAIPLEKQNTYSFDSEAFRYLVAKRHHISFSESEEYEYQTSWAISSKESKRFIDYISKKLRSYTLESHCRSVKYAQFQIKQMIRPILEFLRHILRTKLLVQISRLNQFMQLCPKPIDHSLRKCLSCKNDLTQIGQFWIMEDNPHLLLHDRCSTCFCSVKDHVPIDYILQYNIINESSIDKIEDTINTIIFTCAVFANFLIYSTQSTKDDLFLLDLIQIYEQEKYISRTAQASEMNYKLIYELDMIINRYKREFNRVNSEKIEDNLEKVYEQIELVKKYPEIKEQIVAIRKGQEISAKVI